MPPERAASVLGSFLGLPSLAPASTIDLDRAQITAILEETTLADNKQLSSALFSHADAVTQSIFGERVYNRGIVEFSNVCANDCGYCGIRKHQRDVVRYTMPREEVVEAARWAFDNRMGTLMLQVTGRRVQGPGLHVAGWVLLGRAGRGLRAEPRLAVMAAAFVQAGVSVGLPKRFGACPRSACPHRKCFLSRAQAPARW